MTIPRANEDIVHDEAQEPRITDIAAQSGLARGTSITKAKARAL